MSKVLEELKRKNMSANKLSYATHIAASDLSQALKGKKPFFPAWRKRISSVLDIPETELFPEYKKEAN